MNVGEISKYGCFTDCLFRWYEIVLHLAQKPLNSQTSSLTVISTTGMVNIHTFLGGLDFDGSNAGERGDVWSQSSVDLTVGGRVVRDTQLRLK